MTFSKEITNACKGVAVLMLLAHHLWWSPHPTDCPAMLMSIAYRCKLCVAIFLLLSGYGLAKSGCGWRQTLTKRIPKLFGNYWLVAAVFVPISVFGFGISFTSVYPDGTWWHFPLQLFGANWVNPYDGFNPTWWFMDAIVPLYVLSPILMKLVKWNSLAALVASFVMSGVPVVFFYWSTPFVLGMICAQSNVFCQIKNNLAGWRKWYVIVLAVIGFYLRKDLLLDGFLACVFIVAIFSMCDIGWIRASLSYLGKHSMNIFYTHTFYRCVWFGRDMFSDPAIAFALLLIVSLFTSFALNLLKGILGRFGKRFWYNYNSDKVIVNLI